MLKPQTKHRIITEIFTILGGGKRYQEIFFGTKFLSEFISVDNGRITQHGFGTQSDDYETWATNGENIEILYDGKIVHTYSTYRKDDYGEKFDISTPEEYERIRKMFPRGRWFKYNIDIK